MKEKFFVVFKNEASKQETPQKQENEGRKSKAKLHSLAEQL